MGIHPNIGAWTGSDTDIQRLQQNSSTINEVVFETDFVGGGTRGGRYSANCRKPVSVKSLFLLWSK